MYAIVDCNNFFASCERVFRPDLEHKPVVVLSNNDGCIISRSNEAKAIGIKMGAPLFQIRDLIRQHQVAVFSSNYELYGDLSSRVMQTLRTFSPDVEVYSIDEAFVHLTPVLKEQSPVEFCKVMKARVEQWTGIPVSIGIASTKTLAKLANDRVVKRYKGYKGVFHIDSPERHEKILRDTPVGEVWGIGRRLAKMLNENGIWNAAELRDAKDAWVRKKMAVTGLRTVHELRGIASFSNDEVPEVRKNLLYSRSFGKAVSSYDDLREAVCTFASSAAVKLRRQKSAAAVVYVFVRPAQENISRRYESEGKYFVLPMATDSTPEILKYAVKALEAIYVEGQVYKSAGVMLGSLIPADKIQLNLFDEGDVKRRQQMMKIVDMLNHNFGSNTVRYAATGREDDPQERKDWMPRRSERSPRYSTRLGESLTIGC